jgi:hypothetical protein
VSGAQPLSAEINLVGHPRFCLRLSRLPILPTPSKYLSECEIDASGAGQRRLPVLERRDTVIDESRGTAPHHDVAAFEVQATHRTGAQASFWSLKKTEVSHQGSSG